jgi:hypothetical protein
MYISPLKPYQIHIVWEITQIKPYNFYTSTKIIIKQFGFEFEAIFRLNYFYQRNYTAFTPELLLLPYPMQKKDVKKIKNIAMRLRGYNT